MSRYVGEISGDVPQLPVYGLSLPTPYPTANPAAEPMAPALS